MGGGHARAEHHAGVDGDGVERAVLRRDLGAHLVRDDLGHRVGQVAHLADRFPVLWLRALQLAILVEVPERVALATVARPVIFGVPAPGNFYVNLPPLFLGHFSPIFAPFFPVFSPFSPSCRQDSGNRHQDPEKRSVTVEKRRVKNPKLT